MSTNSPRLSMQIVLQDLRDKAATVAQCEQALEAARADRDDSIRDLLAAGMPKAKVARYAGLSRTQLYNIQLDGRPDLTVDER